MRIHLASRGKRVKDTTRRKFTAQRSEKSIYGEVTVLLPCALNYEGDYLKTRIFVFLIKRTKKRFFSGFYRLLVL
jgi:hypothetical protein